MTSPLAGGQIRAGLGVSTVLPSMDFETYSEAGYVWTGEKWQGIGSQNRGGISVVGAWVYSEHPSTEILSLSYDLKDGRGVHTWVPGLPEPAELFEYLADPTHQIEAFNSFFEFAIWWNIATKRLGWPVLRLSQLVDVAAKAAGFGVARQLELCTKALRTPTPKDVEGQRIMRRVSRPQNPTKKRAEHRITPSLEPDKFERLYQYNQLDVISEDEVAYRCPDLSDFEKEVFRCDQQINAIGVQVDTEHLAACDAIVDEYKRRLNAELYLLTAGAVENGDKVEQIKKWMGRQLGHPIKSLNKDMLAIFLKRTDLPPVVHRVLQIRATLGLKSVAKIKTIKRTLSNDGRLRDLFQYGGAPRTRRWSGSDAQPQNLKSGGPRVTACHTCRRVRWVGVKGPCVCDSRVFQDVDWGIEAAEAALADIATRDLDLVIERWGDPLLVVSGCLRALFIAREGYELICSDYSAIEANALAELAGEKWRQDVFRSHRQIYEASAATMTSTPFTEITQYRKDHDRHHPLRKLGKLAELASGYGGALGGWKAFGAGEFLTDEEIETNVKRWRDASPEIVKFWYRLQDAAIDAIRNPGIRFHVKTANPETTNTISYLFDDGRLYCQLPSGRDLVYHDAYLQEEVRESKRTGREYKTTVIYYWGYDSETKQWRLMDTWGGKLCENVVQAVCRDILAHALVRVHNAGYFIVLHVHDELVAEVPVGFGSVEAFEREMEVLPDWCKTWPIRATGGWRGKRFRKD